MLILNLVITKSLNIVKRILENLSYVILLLIKWLTKGASMLKNITTGIQHLGIPAWDLDQSVAFYEKLGFELLHRKKTHHNETPVEAAFLKLHNLMIELYQLEGELLEEVKSRKNGHLDHFAINTTDVVALHKMMKAEGYNLLDVDLQTIDFFEKGVKFFRILGPSNEVVEFNQVL